MLAGGVESMSRVPMGSDGGAWAMDPMTTTTPASCRRASAPTSSRPSRASTRDDVDAFAVESQQRAAQARGRRATSRSRSSRCEDRNGLVVLDRGRVHPPGTTLEGLAKLTAVVRDDGRDGRLRRGGAAEVPLRRANRARAHRRQLVGHRRRRRAGARRLGEGRARRSGSRRAPASSRPPLSGADPTIMLTGPAPAARKALDKAGLKHRADRPLGDQRGVRRRRAALHAATWTSRTTWSTSTAARSPWASARRDRRHDPRHRCSTSSSAASCSYGLCTLCVGGGMGIATIIERV